MGSFIENDNSETFLTGSGKNTPESSILSKGSFCMSHFIENDEIEENENYITLTDNGNEVSFEVIGEVEKPKRAVSHRLVTIYPEIFLTSSRTNISESSILSKGGFLYERFYRKRRNGRK